MIRSGTCQSSTRGARRLAVLAESGASTVDNYEFCAHWAAGRGATVLDYGCGAGQTVGILRSSGVDAYGCDVFYGGGSYEEMVPAGLRCAVRRMSDSRIPFQDETFDVVVSNQVLEHVADLDAALREIRRVLKPDGVTLNLFPHREVWREGHCGIPFLHRFRKGGRSRIYYAAALRSLGMGEWKGGKSSMQWSRDFCSWLDQWTYYRSLEELHVTFERHFSSTEHIEREWLLARLPVGRYFPPTVQQILARKAAGIVLVSRA